MICDRLSFWALEAKAPSGYSVKLYYPYLTKMHVAAHKWIEYYSNMQLIMSYHSSIEFSPLVYVLPTSQTPNDS